MATLFRFSDLHLELQDMVLLHVIGKRVHIQRDYNVIGDRRPDGSFKLRYKLTVEDGCRSFRFEGKAGFDPDYRDMNPTLSWVPPTNTAVLHVDKATLVRSRHVLQTDTTKVFPSKDLVMAQSDHFSPRLDGFLCRIELAMKHAGFMELFQMDLPEFTATDLERPGYQGFGGLLLATFPNLTSLTLSFLSTISEGNNPWADIPTAKEFGRPIHLFVLWPRRRPCQKGLLDMIMAFAFEGLQGIAEVRLTGYIKTETKQKWETLLNDKTHTEYASHGQVEKAAILAMPESAL